MFRNLQSETVLLLPIALLCSFVIGAIGGKFILPQLRKLNVGQQVRSQGPQTHLKKSGTPTFGGAIFLFPFIILTIAYLLYDFDPYILLALFFVLAHAAIGFADDYIKVRISKDGLSAKQKTILLLIVELIFIVIYLFFIPGDRSFILPFGMGIWRITGFWRLAYAAFLLLYFYACTNAVNMNDGIDGLASSVTIVVLSFILLHALVNYRGKMSQHTIVLASIMIGALLAFLIYNWHKAKVFMGDFGSLALGATTSLLFLQEEIPLAFVLSGIVYVVEIASVFLQVQYFRRTGGKRLFRMAPYHHHLELGGWKEVKIVFFLSFCSLIGSIVAAFSFWPWL